MNNQSNKDQKLKIKVVKSRLMTTLILLTIIVMGILTSEENTSKGFATNMNSPAIVKKDVVNGFSGNGDNVAKKVHVGDIDIAYKMFGRGEPLLLILGYGGAIDTWDPTLIKDLASNYTVIVFDNRGVDQTTSGSKSFTISQFANDTAGLLDVLKIKKTNVLAWSMGGFIAQEIALKYPNKINKLILYNTECGGKESINPNPVVAKNYFATMLNTSGVEYQQNLLHLLIPDSWFKTNPNWQPPSFPTVSKQTIRQQTQAILGFHGICSAIPGISQPTLIVAGTDDILIPPVNSMILTEKIPAAWLVHVKNAGHGLMYQYPDKLGNIVKTFLNNS